MGKLDYATLVKQAKHSSDHMLLLIECMNPLVGKYSSKLFFMERQDAEQELIMAIIEAVQNISNCETSGQCIRYIHNAVKFKHAYLCKKNIRRESVEDRNAEVQNTIYLEKYSQLEFIYDYKEKLQKLPKRQQEILNYLYQGYTDSEIAKLLGVSRQYINRIKKQWR